MILINKIQRSMLVFILGLGISYSFANETNKVREKSDNCNCIFFVDIDNTLFKNGEPIVEMIKQVKKMQNNGEEIYFLSGRKNDSWIQEQLRGWFANVEMDHTNIILKNNNELVAKFKYDLMNEMSKSGKGIVLIDDNIRNINFAQKGFMTSKIPFQSVLVDSDKNYKNTVTKMEKIKIAFK